MTSSLSRHQRAQLGMVVEEGELLDPPPAGKRLPPRLESGFFIAHQLHPEPAAHDLRGTLKRRDRHVPVIRVEQAAYLASAGFHALRQSLARQIPAFHRLGHLTRERLFDGSRREILTFYRAILHRLYLRRRFGFCARLARLSINATSDSRNLLFLIAANPCASRNDRALDMSPLTDSDGSAVPSNNAAIGTPRIAAALTRRPSALDWRQPRTSALAEM
jgi:hypothetical protein